MRHSLLRIVVAAFVVTTLSVGVVALAAKPGPPPPGPTCPPPARGCICYALYAPVVCGPNSCQYSNDCFASCAGWNVGTQCTSIGGPIEL